MSVRKITATLAAGGGTIPLLSADCDLNMTQASGRFRATFPIHAPGVNMSAWAKGSVLDATLSIQGQQVFIGQVDTVRVDYSGGVVNVDGRDLSTRLHDLTIRESFVNRKRSDVVLELAGRAGLHYRGSVGLTGLVGDDAGKEWEDKHRASIADGQSAWSIIQKFAQLDGVKAFVDKEILCYLSDVHFKKSVGTYSYKAPALGSPAAGNVLDISFTRNVNIGKSIKVSINGWHAKKKKKIQGQAQAPGVGGEIEYKDDRGNNMTEAEAKEYARKALADIMAQEYGCSVTIPGNPNLEFGMFSVSGTAFDGPYKMESIHHTVGYTTGFKTMLHGRRSRAG